MARSASLCPCKSSCVHSQRPPVCWLDPTSWQLVLTFSACGTWGRSDLSWSRWGRGQEHCPEIEWLTEGTPKLMQQLQGYGQCAHQVLSYRTGGAAEGPRGCLRRAVLRGVGRWCRLYRDFTLPKLWVECSWIHHLLLEPAPWARASVCSDGRGVSATCTLKPTPLSPSLHGRIPHHLAVSSGSGCGGFISHAVPVCGPGALEAPGWKGASVRQGAWLMAGVFCLQALVPSAKWAMWRRRGGQAASGCYLSWSCTCSSNFDVRAASPTGRSRRTANTSSMATDSNKASTPVLKQTQSHQIQTTEPKGTQIRGRGTKNALGKRIERGHWKSPCRYLGTAEFSFFFQMGRTPVALDPPVNCMAWPLLPGGQGLSRSAHHSAPQPRKILEFGHPKFNHSIEKNSEGGERARSWTVSLCCVCDETQHQKDK